MNAKHTPESIKDLPHVTVEQVIRFRDAALRIEQQRDNLQFSLDKEVRRVMELQTKCDALQRTIIANTVAVHEGIKQQRDELVKQLKVFVDNGGHVPEYEFDNARKLIAKAGA